ncbi:MAG TPA: DUF1015 family protein [Saprospiraceae bacterium]|nr:DUF1015 family protein [Saprospiraceae bacterium]
MKIFPFHAIYPNTNLIASSDAFFSTVRDDYTQYLNSGFFHESPEKAFYIFEIKTGKKTHSGLVVCLDVTDYSSGKIVRHEQTIASSEQEMLKVLLQRGAMVKPVLLCHPDVKEIAKEIEKQKKKQKLFLEIDAPGSGTDYRLYQIPEKDGQELSKLYKSLIPKVYIADGHHRCSTGEKLLKMHKDGKDYSLLLAALFPFDQLDILDYNRVVQLPYNLKLTRFMAEISQVCDIKSIPKPAKPKRKHDMTMCIQDHWYQLRWKDDVLKKYKKLPAILDAHVLDEEVMDKILGIKDARTDNRIEYASGDLGPERVEEKARSSDHHIGFCIYPVQFDELVKVSDSGGTLPPKSTWFEPRMINGFIVKKY